MDVIKTTSKPLSKFENGLVNNNFYYTPYIVNNKEMNYIVSIIKKEMIKFDAYSSLFPDTWVDNSIIDIVLKELGKNYLSFQIEPWDTGTRIFFAPDEQYLFEVCTGFLLQKNIIIMPIHDQQNQHFFLAIINNIEETFLIYDSIQPKSHNKLLKTRYYTDCYVNFMKFTIMYNNQNTESKFLDKYTTCFYPKSYYQKGFNDCGIYTIIHAELYMLNCDIVKS